MSEDKMKLAFANRYLQPIRYDESFEKSRNDFESGWKACAAIKDAEIAEMNANLAKGKRLLSEQMEITNERTKLAIEQREEIAARDLMIKELREALRVIADPGSNHPYYSDRSVERAYEDIAEEAYTNSEHHNYKVLDKMLLEAEIKGLRNQQPVSNNRRLCELGNALSELNKE